MKKILFVVATTISGCAFAQNVGINTTSPKVTLDVTGQPTSTTILDGITAPRITGTQLRAKTYTSDQLGALVFVTTADTAPAGQTIDVRSSGYYYFNGTKWILVNSNASEPWYSATSNTGATSNTENIYQTGRVAIGGSSFSNGGALNVTGGLRASLGNPGNDAANVGYAFASDGDTGIFASGGTPSTGNTLKLTVDNVATANVTTTGVGIGTSSPETRLDLVNTGGSAIKIVDGTQGDGKVLKSSQYGVGSWQQMLRPKPTADNGTYVIEANANGIANANDANNIKKISFNVAQPGWYSMKSRFYMQAQDAPNNEGFFWIAITDHPTDINGGELMYEYRAYVNKISTADGASPPSGTLIYLRTGTYYLYYKTVNTRYASTGERRFVFYYLE